MAIYKTGEQGIHPEIERYRTKEELKTSFIFSSDKKLDSIIQHISGMPWKLESYFTQLGDVNNNFETISLDVGIHQSYERIMKLKVYLQSPITQSTPDEINGEFIINAGFLPKRNDLFVAELTGGRLGLFQILEVNNNTYNNHQCYTCNFKLFTFLEGNNVSYYNKLIEKCVGPGKVYNDDYKFNQNTPLLNVNEYTIREDLIKAKNDLINYYLKNFINNENRLLQYPTQNKTYVDTYLLDFIFKIISFTEYPELSKLSRIDYKDKEINNTVLDMLIERNPQMLYRLDKHLGYKPIKQNKTNLNSRNISLIGIDYIIGKITENTYNPKPIEVDKKFKPNLEASVKMTHNETIKKTTDNIKKANNDFILMVPKLEFEMNNKTEEKEDEERNDVIPKENESNTTETKTKELVKEEFNKDEEQIIENRNDNDINGTVEEIEEILEDGEKSGYINNNETTEIDFEFTPIASNLSFEDNEANEETAVLKPKNINVSIKATKQYNLFKKK